MRPDDGGRVRYEVPRTVVDVQLPAFSPSNRRRYTVNITNVDKFAFQVIRHDTGTVLYARLLLSIDYLLSFYAQTSTTLW